MELFDALRKIGIVPLILAKIYTATILYVLESLHNNNIVYRDLKPENIILSKEPIIIDFGLATLAD